ncbi:Chemotaxis protein methyltransferase Cher2 [Rubripirellula obstinata]|uniref:protein-glutamate O-methyltransferase n=1 Tax=Rubripirellula obstinata TaxID=406547 RepID=A0A5B1CDE6_9BACT|nr:protein-glutamate O-methyltransferase CheR [Rubripirellula obstinata]KAA1257779.1 Chemotaxis protein methyltransferase Cher2 [Rubripirellula obstinata]
MQIDEKDVDAVCGLVLDLCGVYLDSSKSYLIESRLGEIVKRHGCNSYREVVDRVRRTSDLRLKSEIIDAITTNETLFFRDNSPFEAFKHKAFPELLDKKQSSPFPKRVRIWSAATSTGQEAYSLAMSICELLPDADTWDIQILATDISDAAIAKASRGKYTGHDIKRGVSQEYLNRYFKRIGNDWAVDDRIRSMISFKTFNLHDSFASLGQFDMIFCRNVAIYFTPEARKSLFQRLIQNLSTHGYLFVGSAEMLTNVGPEFKPQNHCGSVFYQPNVPKLVS